MSGLAYDIKYFNKLDLIWKYNNIHIKEGNKWKAAILDEQKTIQTKSYVFWTMQLTRNIPEDN